MRNKTVAAFPTGTAFNASVNGPAIPAEFLVRGSLQGTFAGTSPSGTLKLQGSNDQPGGGNPAVFQPTNFSDIASATVTVSAAGTFATPVTELAYRWVRAVWTYTSGVVTVTNQPSFHGSGWGAG